MTATRPTYILVTPARNEAAYIERTLASVVAQTLLPLKWVIVSDGSTDATDELVLKYAAKHDWIELLRTPPRGERDFAGKVFAFNHGHKHVAALKYDIIGNIDADISFERDFFEFLMGKFALDPRLGVAGTPFTEDGKTYDFRFASLDHVSGACQLFRRECYESIGGYMPMKEGGLDLVAVTTARMLGWKTRTFTERTCEHHRKTQTGKHMGLVGQFKSGYHDYLMGSSFTFQLLRAIRHFRETPIILGGCSLFIGFCAAMLTRAKPPVSREFIAFRQQEQKERIKEQLRKVFAGGAAH